MIYVNAPFTILFLILGHVSASLYPISPIANTVYDAGHSVTVEWIDDDTTPHLQDIFIDKIDLYLGDNTFIATVATNVDPLKEFQSITIPQNAEENTKYTLRFFCGGPPTIIYTAYFKIQNSGELTNNMLLNDSSSGLPDVLDSVTTSAFNESDSASWYRPVLTIVLPNMTYATTLAPTRIVASIEDSSNRPSSTPSYDNGVPGGMNWQFNFVFIVLPAVFAFAVAL